MLFILVYGWEINFFAAKVNAKNILAINTLIIQIFLLISMHVYLEQLRYFQMSTSDI